jgi:serine/threonine-protein phosphatase 2A activator
MDGFVVPRDQLVKDEIDLKQWLESVAHKRLIDFLEGCNNEIKGKRISQAPVASPQIERLLAMLDALTALLAEHPPIEQPQRFGNKAFRAYHAALCEKAPALVRTMLGPEAEAAAVELAPYLTMSFGNPTRLDYGTGHETSFVIMLTCMHQLKLLQGPEDLANVPLRFQKQKHFTWFKKNETFSFKKGFLTDMCVCVERFSVGTCWSRRAHTEVCKFLGGNQFQIVF